MFKFCYEVPSDVVNTNLSESFSPLFENHTKVDKGGCPSNGHSNVTFLDPAFTVTSDIASSITRIGSESEILLISITFHINTYSVSASMYVFVWMGVFLVGD